MNTAVATTNAIGFKLGGDANFTSLQGYIDTSYAVLSGCFGPPDLSSIDNYKSDAGWTITFSDGVVATIYNWKDGPNYCGPEDGTPVIDITDWHIGGFNSTGVVSRVEEVIGAYLDMVCHNPTHEKLVTKLVAAL